MENKLLPEPVYQMILKHIEENRGNTNGDIVIDFNLRKELEKFFIEIIQDKLNLEIITDKSYMFYTNFINTPDKYIKNQLPALHHVEFSVVGCGFEYDTEDNIIFIRLRLRDFHNVYQLTHNLYVHHSLEDNLKIIMDNQIRQVESEMNYLKEKKKLLLKLKKNKFNK